MTARPATPHFFADPAVAAEARKDRWRRFQTFDVPVLRLIGFTFNFVAVLVNNRFVLGTLSFDQALFVAFVLMGYALISWAILHFLWARVTRVDLGDVFLVLDVFVLAFVVYVSGANRSLLWIVFAARTADQVAMSFRRALFFAHLGTLTYAALIGYVAFVQHRPIGWGIEACKVFFLYVLCLYITLTARTAEARRKRVTDARRTAEQAVWQATERQRALEDALQRLETAGRVKNEFLANVSHELRTPLNSILGSTDLLLDSPVTRDQRETLGVVRESAESLTALVSNILDFAKIEARRLPLETIPVRVRDLVGSTLRMFAARAHLKHLELVCHIARDVPDVVLGDPLRLRQIITNLVGNAIKFTETGEVVVHLQREAEERDRIALRFAVRDTGIGVPASRQHAIFEAFTQADGSNTRKYGGTGLGLTIATELVELMQGRLWVESEEGRGSTFTFVAWFGRAPDGERTVEDARIGVALIADANASARAALVDALARWSSSVVEADSGQSALSAVERRRHSAAPIDVAFIDAGLPGADGFEIATRMHASLGVRHIVMVLRSSHQTADAQRARALGARYMTTPATDAALKAVVAAISAPAAGAPAAPDAAARPLRVLIVDDQMVNQAITAAMLKRAGHAVAMANDGNEALARIDADRYDVILMDLQMPGMDGLETARAIRRIEAARPHAIRSTIIAVTARVLDEDRRRCRAAGMDDFLSKPLDREALFEALRQVPAGRPHASGADALEGLTPLISDPALVLHVAELFLATVPAEIDELQRALIRRDTAGVRSLAHAVRGALANFADVDVSAAERLEWLGDHATLDGADEAFTQLGAEVDRLNQRLRQILNRV